jgi:murein DD-endopeptidase MepM/ murein hydrolase activator NlpD
MVGSDVRALQVALSHRGYPVPATGKFGAQTYGAVIRFQRAHGLGADGIVGPATLAAIRTTRHRRPARRGVLAAHALGSRPLRVGMLGTDVRALQVALSGHGYRVPATGKFGALTHAAVVRFQRAHGLTPDGIVGPATLAALRGESAGSSGGHVWTFPLRPLSLVASPAFWTLDQGVDVPTVGHACGSSVLAVAVANGTIVREGIAGFGSTAPVLRVEVGSLAGRYVYYGHTVALVGVGAPVSRGQPIAEIGCGRVGISSGPHLEIGVSAPGGPVCCPRMGETAGLMASILRVLY